MIHDEFKPCQARKSCKLLRYSQTNFTNYTTRQVPTPLRYDDAVMSSTQSYEQTGEKIVLAFDPGGTTGIALIDGTGAILRTEAYSPSEVLAYAQRMEVRRRTFTPVEHFAVIIEKGPEWQQHSPITRSVEVKLREVFPDAHLVTPNRWKGHPKARCPERVNTKHERDAVKLARWFLFTRSVSAENKKGIAGQARRR